MSGDIFGCHNRGGGAIGTQWVEAKDTAKSYYNVQGSLHNKALTGPKCQSCWAWEPYKLTVLVCKAENLGKFIKTINEYHPERNIANQLLASAGGISLLTYAKGAFPLMSIRYTTWGKASHRDSEPVTVGLSALSSTFLVNGHMKPFPQFASHLLKN